MFRLAMVLALVALVLAVLGGCPKSGDEEAAPGGYVQPEPEPGMVAPAAPGGAPAPANTMDQGGVEPPPPPPAG